MALVAAAAVFLGAHGSQRRHGRPSDGLGELRAHVFGLCERDHPAKGAKRLSDPSPDQALGQRGSGQVVDGAASCRLPEHGDLVRVAAEPIIAPPAWIHTITGSRSLAEAAGVHTFR